jgi:hypothetical protein
VNLHAIAGPIVGVVNPNKTGNLYLSTGYTTGANGKQIPSYDPFEDVVMQVQALTGPELRQLDALNIEGTRRAVYLYGNVEGVNRPRNKGGDLLTFDGETWLIVVVLEAWGDWCKVAVALQKGGPPDA